MHRKKFRTIQQVARTSAFALLVFAGCSKVDGPVGSAGGHLNIDVAPLQLPGVTDAVYRLTVKNLAGQTVWQKTLSSTQYGDGSGAASYVGTCDATSNPNRIELELESLSAGGNLLSPTADYANPAPLGSPIFLTAECRADADVPVEFNLNIARAGEQGFFDISVNFQDLFCSAKLDCERTSGGAPVPLELLFNPLTGKRDLTTVLGFACTAGPDQDTYLHMSQVEIDCTGTNAQVFYVDSQAGPGNLDPPFPGPSNDSDLIFQAATYRGEELIGTSNKFYWNVAIGLNEDAFPNLAPCTLRARATASDGPLANGTTPDGMRWPYIDWEVPLVDAGGDMACHAHELGDGTEVEVKYTDAPITFIASIQRTNPNATTLNGCDPDEACGACSSTCYLGGGTGIDDVTGGGSGGDPAPTLAEELDTKVNPDDIVGLVASPTGGLTLAAQNYDLPFLWAANHDDDTVSKIDTRTMKEVGRYRVCNGPSRTAVDLDGNGFVTCRFDGGVTKIAVVDPDCEDRNNNLVIDTSRDLDGNGIIQGAELLAAGQDECVLWTKYPAGSGTTYATTCNETYICGRAAGVDVNNNVWIGIWNNSRLYQLNGATGATIKSWPLAIHPYGLAVGKDGMIWIASRDPNGAISRVNPQTGAEVVWKTGSANYSTPGTAQAYGTASAASTDNYGITIDPWGAIWLGQYSAAGLKRFVPNADGLTGTFYGPYGRPDGNATTRGVGVKVNYTAQGVLTGAEVYSGHQYSACGNTVSYAKLDASGAVLSHGVIAVPGLSGSIGNAVDVDGNVWGVSYCTGTATRYTVAYGAAPNYTPTVTVAGNVTIGTHPYSYSDMTGQALRDLAGVDGHYRHRWTGWSTGATWWKTLSLQASLPGGSTVTWLEVRWRSGDDATALNSAAWTTPITVNNTTTMPIDLSPGAGARRTAKYFDLEVTFRTTDPGGQVPELTGIGLAVYHLP
ncbi:MAG: hypothetical protein CVU56_14675 [Deltaproteobacteria bacterium HGW-Deltaproteobacteria-14]|jgi:hypothetical protein|nr:MAG: hypothetical protein CVU56_14675 [Deltaproteobacteria bacterium HGW-Deltaproteobacteria-14]